MIYVCNLLGMKLYISNIYISVGNTSGIFNTLFLPSGSSIKMNVA